MAILKLDVVNQLLKMLNWKSPGLDGIYGFWLKKFTSLHQEITVLNRSVQMVNIAEWSVESTAMLVQKDASKGNVLGEL